MSALRSLRRRRGPRPGGRPHRGRCGFHPGPSITVLAIATRRVTHLGDVHTGIPIWLTNTTVLTERVTAHPQNTDLRTYDLAGHVTGTQALTSPLDLITSGS